MHHWFLVEYRKILFKFSDLIYSTSTVVFFLAGFSVSTTRELGNGLSSDFPFIEKPQHIIAAKKKRSYQKNIKIQKTAHKKP